MKEVAWSTSAACGYPGKSVYFTNYHNFYPLLLQLTLLKGDLDFTCRALIDLSTSLQLQDLYCFRWLGAEESSLTFKSQEECTQKAIRKENFKNWSKHLLVFMGGEWQGEGRHFHSFMIQGRTHDNCHFVWMWVSLSGHPPSSPSQ